jgi:hypothetical protein
MDLADLPIRTNGTTVKVDASWWNDIRSVLLGLYGTGTTGNTQQALANNTTAVITDLIFASASIIDFEVNYTSVRGTARQSGKLRGFFNTQWNLLHESTNEDCGLTFSIDTVTGQVSYTTTNDVVGKIQWKTTSTFAIEA